MRAIEEVCKDRFANNLSVVNYIKLVFIYLANKSIASL